VRKPSFGSTRNRSFAAATVLATVLLSQQCSLPPKSHFKPEKAAAAAVKKQWYRYGAVYELDAYGVFTSFKAVKGDNRVDYVIQKQIRIVTAEGAKFATIPIVKKSGDLVAFMVCLEDSLGAPIALDRERIRKQYLSSGKVIIPQACAGCRIGLSMTFRDTSIPVWSVHHFMREIPVVTSRFTFSTDNLGEYACKLSGDSSHIRQSGELCANKGKKVWTGENLDPGDNDILQPGQNPVVSVALRYHPDFQDFQRYRTWEDLACQYSDHYHPGMDSGAAADSLKKIVRKIVANLTDTLQMAEEILRWVGRNISLRTSALKPVNVAAAIKAGEGNELETAALLNDMLRAAGLTSELLITRSRDRGGFDTSFVTLMALEKPLVITECGGRRYCSDPCDRYVLFGQYPPEYFSMSGLNLHTKKIEPVPRPRLETYRLNSRLLIRLEPSAKQQFHLVFSDLSAYQIRKSWNYCTEKCKEWKVRRYIKALDEFNELRRFTITGLDTPSGLVKIDADFFMKRTPVRQSDASVFVVRDFIMPLLTAIDGMRTSPFENLFSGEQTDTVEFMKIPGKIMNPDFKYADVRDTLIESTCRQVETDSSYMLIRHAEFKNVRLSASETNALFPDIEKLNKARESVITMR
jgi:hypothetical protein